MGVRAPLGRSRTGAIPVETKITGPWRCRIAWRAGRAMAKLRLPGALALSRYGASSLHAWVRVDGGEWRDTGARIRVDARLVGGRG